jgi:hypothetical protein
VYVSYSIFFGSEACAYIIFFDLKASYFLKAYARIIFSVRKLVALRVLASVYGWISVGIHRLLSPWSEHLFALATVSFNVLLDICICRVDLHRPSVL